MSNYLPRTQKKREIQQKQENKLRRMVEKGASLAKLVDTAEVVCASTNPDDQCRETTLLHSG